jgi:chromosome segregation ATPase
MTWKKNLGAIDRELEVEKRNSLALRREYRALKQQLDGQLEINTRLHYDLHNKKMECDRVIVQQQERIQELIAQSDGRSDEVVALREAVSRLDNRLADANGQIKNYEHRLGLAQDTHKVLTSSNQMLGERCDKLDMRVGLLIDTVFNMSQP